MVSYENALNIANDFIDGDVFKINCAYELKEAFIFDHSELVYGAQVPFAVLKKTGGIMDFSNFMLKYDHTWDELKPINFETGERLPVIDTPDDDEE